MKYVKNGGSTDCFPEETDNELWVGSGYLTIESLIELSQKKWPTKSLSDIKIEAVNHHEYNIYYDVYESGDYVDYIVLSVE